MTLLDKYSELISSAKSSGIENLQVREQDKVLYIDGTATSAESRDKLWEIYNRIDPDYRSADLVMNIQAPAATEYIVKAGDNLTKIGRMVGTDWQKIYEENKQLIGSNPDLIKPGQVLKIPS